MQGFGDTGSVCSGNCYLLPELRGNIHQQAEECSTYEWTEEDKHQQ